LSEELIVEKVSKSFGKLRAISDVSFSVTENEIYGIAGPNGACKTTLFNTISGIPYHPDAGRLIFKGKPIHHMYPHLICRQGIARTFQRETVFDTMTVYENVIVGAAFGNRRKRKVDCKKKAEQVLELVGYEGSLDQVARHLALFDKKRLMWASALASEPKLMLLDEPASGLNQLEVQQTIDLIRLINSTGITIILIEHVLPLLLTLSHRIMILNEGIVLLEGTSEQVVADERVIEAYLGRRH
jgi:branched-chain amino acid transport system ATP-binding protein